MANAFDAITAALDSAGSVSNTINRYLSDDAKRSTQNKQIQLKEDINNKMMEIQRSNNSDEWQTKMDGYFQELKSSMSNKDSPYYCKNNLQAEQFTQILDEARVSVNQEVGQLVFKADREKAIVDYRNSLTLLSQNESGQNYINKANELAKSLFDCGYISREQYQQQLDTNFDTAYINTATAAFDGTIEEAIKRGDSKETLIKMALDNVTNLMGIDTEGLPKTFDKEAMNKTLKKTFEQNYNAYLADYQQGNANKLSEINQQMRQARTEQERLSIARQGQRAMNGMTGNMLSEDDRNKYAAYFDYEIKGGASGSSSSGSTSKKPNSSFEELIKVAPGETLEMIKKNPELCPYDAAEMYSDNLLKWFMTEDHKENYDLNTEERLETYGRLYEHRTAKETIADSVFTEIKKKYPDLAGYIDNKAAGLKDYIKKNPKSFTEQDLGQVTAWCVDWALSANSNATNDDFKKDFDNMINTFYVSSIKSVTLNDKGKLKQTFNANKASDIAQAAKIASSNDFVFTDQFGQEEWAPGKREALEAKGGIVNVMQNAVAGTLGLSENDYKDLGFYYKPDASGNDMTSTPIITYKDKAYEVVADDNGKGFKVREYKVDDKGNMQTIRELDGKTGGKLKEVMRANQKAEAKQAYNDAHDTRTQLEDSRVEEVTNKMTTATTMPKAVEKVWGSNSEEWKKTQNTSDARQRLFHDTESAIIKAQKKVEKGKMTEAEFKQSYGIDYSDWIESSEETYRFNLILNSK